MKSNWSVFKVLEVLVLIVLVALLLLPEIVETGIRYKLNTLDNCSVGNVKISIPRRSIRLSEVVLDSFPVGQKNLVNGRIKVLKFSGIHLFEVLYKKNIILDEIIFRSPDLQFSQAKNKQFAQSEKSKSSFDRIELKKVKLVNGSITEIDSLGGISLVNDLSLELGPLEFVKDSFIMSVTDWKISSNSFNHITSDQLYKISFYKIEGSSDANTLIVDSLRIKPSYNEIEFSKKVPFQTDRFDLICDRIMLDNITLQDNHIGNLRVVTPKLKVFRNKKIARDPELKFQLLQYYLKTFPFSFAVDTMLVSDGNVRYRELGEKSLETGEIIFSEIAMVITGLSGRNNSNDTLKIKANSGFMESGKLNATITFPYNHASFECKGELKQLALSELNRISEPAAGVFINSGTLYSMPFSFKATNSFSSGELLLNYRNLDFVVQNKPNGDTDNLFSKVKTLVASIFIKKDSKKDEGDISLEGKICVERRSDRFIFNYMWKSIFSGIKSALSGAIADVKPEQTKPC